MLIFDLSRRGRGATTQYPAGQADISDLPAEFLRSQPPPLPEVSELDVVRHYTRLSQKNYAIDTHFYPLGSCTMKYNPKAANILARLPGFAGCHPRGTERFAQGTLACLYDLQQILKEVTGMEGISLTPAAGAQGEFCGVAMIRAYHQSRNDSSRCEILVPDAAHGTNPASAAMCGYSVREIPTAPDGNVDLAALRSTLGPQTAGIMLTNPSTLGVFEHQIPAIADVVHNAGGLLYYDGANLNGILGKVRPGDMGFDVIHLNLHKTFSTPHGGGGPGAGPVGVNTKLLPFLPLPRLERNGEHYRWLAEEDCPHSIGRLSAFAGNVGVLLRAYVYIRLLGRQGMQRVAEYATLNANYLLKRLTAGGFTAAFPNRRAAHEFIVTLAELKKIQGISAMDVAKRLLDYGFYAPTVYFPMLVQECLLIEPTETESKETLDTFVEALCKIGQEAKETPDLVRQAPHHTPVRRLDEVRAARHPDLAWKPK